MVCNCRSGKLCCSWRLVSDTSHVFVPLGVNICLTYALRTKARKLYPIRVRLVNDVTGKSGWFTVAYVPVVRTEKESSAAERGRLRRCGILQRVLYLAFRSAIAASHTGVLLRVGDRIITAFIRLLMYIADQPEERAVLGLKSGKCAFPCSACMVSVSAMVDERALRASERAVVSTLEREHQGFTLRRDRRNRTLRLALEAVDSTTSVVPALASMAGLSTPPYLLFKMVSFDILHVRTWSRRGLLSSSASTHLLCYCTRPMNFC